MSNWDSFFNEVKQKDYYQSLMSFLDEEYKTKTIFPPRENMFKAFELCELDNLKVVIIGQDPYHEVNQAMGLSFSVPSTTEIPPSLINIYKEIYLEFGYKMKRNGDLTYLAKQGVLLYNVYLSVVASHALSHKRVEYEKLAIDLMKFLNNLDQPIVFMLWGNFAKQFAKYITNPNKLVLQSSHPSPLSANRGGWFDTNQFKRCNEYLLEHGVKPIDWKN